MEWYHTLNKPAFNPPDWLFAPVWTVLYITIALSLIIYLRNGHLKEKSAGIIAFLAQLFLNLIWAPTFFANQNINGAFAIIILLIFAILITIILFYKHSKVAAILLLPYFVWTCFAAYLNFEILRLN